ncbi:MAG: MATE family efflux transporter [Pseudomonadota bacterium]
MTEPQRGDVTHSRVLRIAVPVVLANATVPLLGAVDTGVVGQLGSAAPIGAVGIGTVILSAIYWIFGFLRMGTAGLTAQALGRADRGEVAAMLTRSLAIGALGGVLCIALQGGIFAAAFRLAPASAEVEILAREYLAIRIWSAPAAIALYGIMGWLLAHERAGAMLVLQAVMNGINIALDLWFVPGLGWGVPGVAIATVIAEMAGLGLGLWLVRGGFTGGYWRDWGAVFARAPLRAMANLNRDILIRSLLLQASITSFLFLAAGEGDAALAANQILLQFLMVASHMLDGFAFAAEALVGQALGARNRGALSRAVLACGIWSAGLTVALVVCIALVGPVAIDWMSTAPEVRAAARDFLPWMVLLPACGVLGFLFDGVFIGATRGSDMRQTMVQSFTVYLLAAAVLVPPLGNNGLWAALNLFFLVRGLTLWRRYPALWVEAREVKTSAA